MTTCFLKGGFRGKKRKTPPPPKPKSYHARLFVYRPKHVYTHFLDLLVGQGFPYRFNQTSQCRESSFENRKKKLSIFVRFTLQLEAYVRFCFITTSITCDASSPLSSFEARVYEDIFHRVQVIPPYLFTKIRTTKKKKTQNQNQPNKPINRYTIEAAQICEWDCLQDHNRNTCTLEKGFNNNSTQKIRAPRRYSRE